MRGIGAYNPIKINALCEILAITRENDAAEHKVLYYQLLRAMLSFGTTIFDHGRHGHTSPTLTSLCN
jgi:hypothetical protein